MQSVTSWAAIWPPLSLCILASLARKHGDVLLIDCNVEDDPGIESTVARIVSFGPDIVVVNTAFPSIKFDCEAARAIKDACPSSIIVGFGVFFTLLDERAMEFCKSFDLGITGEPEPTFEHLLDRVSNDESYVGLPGLLWREGGSVKKGGQRPFVEDLDHIPHPARDLLHNERYVLPNNGRPFTLVNAARGCPYKCNYCIATVYYGRKVRRHSLDYVLDEIEECSRKYGLRDFLMWEESFTLDKKYALAFCDGLERRGLDISWAATTRADAVDEEVLRAMKRTGCFLLGLGIESSSQEILDMADKGESVDDIRKAVALCKKLGLQTMGHFIFGLPGETERTIDETIEFAVSLGLSYVQCYVAVPYPKTALGELARERGWLSTEDWSRFDFGGNSVMKMDSIDPSIVDNARNRMFRRFYFRPSYMLGQLGKLITKPRQLLQASGFLKWILRRK